MATRGRRSSRGWTDTDDEMVPFISERIAATLSHRKMSARGLARKTGDRQQTIDLMARGETKKCRRFRLRRVARVLRVPLKWLTGEIGPLPFAPFAGALDPFGKGLAFLTSGLPPNDNPPRVQLLENAFMTQCHAAIIRDLEKRFGERAQEEYEAWGFDLLVALFHVTNDRSWQLVAIARAGTQSNPEVRLALLDTWDLLLQPWFEGRCCPNWKAILQTVQIVAPTSLNYDALKTRVYDLYPELAKLRAHNEAMIAQNGHPETEV